MRLDKVMEKATPGAWVASGDGIDSRDGRIVSTWSVELQRVSDDRLDGESWLDMRVRTQPERDACRDVARIHAALIAHWHDYGPSLLAALEGVIRAIEHQPGKGLATTRALIAEAKEVKGV